MGLIRYHYNVYIAGIYISLLLRHKEAICYFGKYVCKHGNDCYSNENTQIIDNTNAVFVSEVEWQSWLREGGKDCGYGEYTSATACISDALLRENRCIIHACAFRYRNKAWLIAGESGAGKSTQVRNLQNIDHKDFNVICGDRPALEFIRKKADNIDISGNETNKNIIDAMMRQANADIEYIYVHPTPWNGKENWNGAKGAPLAGIIFLERGEKNLFTTLASKDAIFKTINSLIYSGKNEENIKNMSKFADSLLRCVPTYLLISHDVPASTKLLYESLFLEEGASHDRQVPARDRFD